MIPLTDTTAVSESDLIRRKMMANDFYGGILSVNYTSGRWTSSIGGGWNRYDGDHFGQLIWLRYASNSEINQEYYNNNGLKTDANVYAKTNFSLTENLNIYGDIQYRHIDYEMKGTDDDFIDDVQRDLTQDHHFDFINPKTGLYYNINDRMNAYASFALGHREPTRTHFKEATGDLTKTPKSETLFDYELGYRYQGKIFALGVNLYYMDYIDQLVPTGEKNSVGYDIMTNVDDSYRRGIEIMGGVKISELIDWNLNLTLSQNKINNFTYWSSYYDADWSETYESRTMGETDIAYSPSIIGGSRLSYQIMKDFNLSLISKYVGKQYFDNLSSENREIKAYFINNIELDYSFSTKFIHEISLKFQLNNIANVKYANNAYGGVWHENGVEKTWAYYFPQAGIHFMTGISLKF
jgi:iron complex outermembrane receptor protein